MAQLPKGGLVGGHGKPIHGSCAIYFPGGIYRRMGMCREVIFSAFQFHDTILYLGFGERTLVFKVGKQYICVYIFIYFCILMKGSPKFSFRNSTFRFPVFSSRTRLLYYVYPPGNDRISLPKAVFESMIFRTPPGGICDLSLRGGSSQLVSG